MPRSLIDSKIPLEGKIDVSQPVMLVAQQDTGIYILCLVTYITTLSDDPNYELVFSPYFSGNYLSADGEGGTIDNSVNLLQGLAFNTDAVDSNPANTYGDIDAITAITRPSYVHNSDNTPNGNFYKVDNTTVAMLVFTSANTFSVLDSGGNTLGNLLIQTGSLSSGQQYMLTTVDSSSSTGFDIQSTNTYFNYPNMYAGENYSLSFSGVTPFRFLYQMTNTQKLNVSSGEIDYLLTPSVCEKNGLNPNTNDSIPKKTLPYECNSYDGVDSYNVLRYIDYYVYTKDSEPSQTVGLATTSTNDYQTDKTYFNFYPTTFFPSNISFDFGSINKASTACIPILSNDTDPTINYDATGFMRYSFYFWASGFTSYSNNASVSRSPITTQNSTGFITSGGLPVNSTGWTTLSDCQRTYFYDYCDPTTVPVYCGSCLGACATGQTCSNNPGFTPTQISGDPFTCGIAPTPPTPPTPSDVQTFWEKYKKEIIILIIVFVVLAIIFLIFVFINPKNKNSGSTTQREIYVG